jgi:hypothetical protein
MRARRSSERGSHGEARPRPVAREVAAPLGRRADAADQRHPLEEIDQRRGELQFAAISLGGRIYAEKPKKCTKRLGKQWNA